MAKRSGNDEMVPLTQADLDRFHKNAPAAVRRRGWHAMREEVFCGAQTVLYGGLPIVGLLWWDWSATGMLMFLLFGSWIGIFCDAAKFMALQKQAVAFAAARFDDWHVWVVTAALRDGTNEVYPAHIRAKWQPFAGLFVDFVMGGISTFLVVVMLTSGGWLNAEVFQSLGFFLGLVSLLVIRIGGTVAEIVHHKLNGGDLAVRADEDRPVKVRVGLRGAGLFLMVFLTAMLTEGEGEPTVAPKNIMLVIHGLVVTMGLLKLFGPIMLRSETEWLRNYLAKREKDQDATSLQSP